MELNDRAFSKVRSLVLLCVLLLLFGCAAQQTTCDIKDKEYQLIYEENPKYPRDAYEQRIEGWTSLELTIDEKGSVSDALVADASPKGVFDKMSLAAARKNKFTPRIVNCEPVPVYGVVLRHNFSMDD